jgi:CPA1 family monovalent cation:H+ antiporter
MLIGLSLRGVIERVGGFGVVLQEMALPILVIIVAMSAARFVWVFGSDLVIATLRRLGLARLAPLGPRCATVLGWAGMRGVVTLAVALSLPEDFPGRDFMLVAAFAVILATVLIQGTTLGAVIRWAGLSETEADRPRLTMSQAEAAMAQAQAELVEKRAYDADGTLIHPKLLERYRHKAASVADYAARVEEYGPTLHAQFDLVLEAVAVARAELIRLHRGGEIDEETLQELERDLDLEELSAMAAKA